MNFLKKRSLVDILTYRGLFYSAGVYFVGIIALVLVLYFKLSSDFGKVNEVIINQTAMSVLPDLQDGNFYGVKHSLDQILKSQNFKGITVLGSRKQVFAQSGVENEEVAKAVTGMEIPQGNQPVFLTVGKDKIIVKGIYDQNGILWGVMAGVSNQSMFIALIRNIVLLLVFVIFLVVCAHIAASCFVIRKSLRPLTNFTKDINNIANRLDEVVVADDKLAIIPDDVNSFAGSLKYQDGAGDEICNLLGAFSKLIQKLDQFCRGYVSNSNLAAIGRTTAMVAHDVRKPLAGMKALLASLPHLRDNPREIEKMVVSVDQTIDRTNSMLSEILDFSKDATSLEIGEHDPQSIITAALSEVAREKADTDIAIEYSLAHTNYLKVDGNRIIRIITNIVSNAVEATNSGGKIWFKTSDVGDCMLVTIGNNGPEIPAEVRAKIFDPFYTKGKKGGTGLGLAICRKIVEMHGGDISVISAPLSTEFTIALPAQYGRLQVKPHDLIHNLSEFKKFKDEAEVREEYGDSANAAEFMRINKERGRLSYLLIVDDEPLFRESVRSLLSTTDIKDYVRIIEAESAEVGLKLFEARNFDYVIADIDLGKFKMNGYEMTQLLLEKYSETHVLIHSNKRKDEMDKNIREIKSERFLGFLPKPMKTSELLQFLACKTFEPTKTPLQIASEAEKPKKKVLVVNDDDQLLIAMGIMLKAPDVEILKAVNVNKAIEHFGEHKIDVVFSDINLGANSPDGFDLLKHVRSNVGKTPFYFISGYPKSDEWPQAEKLGADGYYQLPIDFNVLKEVI